MWFLRFSVIICVLIVLAPTNELTLNAQTVLSIETEQNMAFNESCLIGAFKITSGNIAECLEHCLENCLCQLFQISQDTTCQLCSTNKWEDKSFLHDKEGCNVFIYYRKLLPYSSEKLDDQCDGSCYKWFNCCKQSGLCLNNGTCQPSFSKSFRERFTCQCPDGYRGDRCEQPIKSCDAFFKGSRRPGLYKVLDSDLGLYEVYCDFDDSKTWTLVQSYRRENSQEMTPISKALFNNYPMKENNVNESWLGYRLGKARMLSIKDDSTFVRFTCDYEKHHDARKSDFVQIRIKNEPLDVIELNGKHAATIEHGQIAEESSLFEGCTIWLSQQDTDVLHTEFYVGGSGSSLSCNFMTMFEDEDDDDMEMCRFVHFFGSYWSECTYSQHACLISDESTTQIWFGN